MNAATALLQVVTALVFNKCFDALKVKIVGFKLNVMCCVILDQMLRNGIQMVGQNAVLTS